jgi:pimeloyl-ACP methyl ester carboxylesterase
VSKPNGQWIRKPETSTAIIFVHGLLSDSESCWTSGSVYWPDLLRAEDPISHAGIYVFSYRTDVFAGSYSIGDIVETLYAYLKLDKLLTLQTLVFVCHSMGGIVVRQFLVTRQLALINRNVRIGLFLIASPSLGSRYANLLSAVAEVLGSSQAKALRFSEGNTWLNDLDRNFMNLKESTERRRLSIRGQELVEDQFIILPAFLRTKVVPPFTGARYFGDPQRIEYSDHFTIAKPAGRDALQHRLLVDFIIRMDSAEPTAALEASNTVDSISDRKLLPPLTAILAVPESKGFWGCSNSEGAMIQEDVEAFLAEAAVARDAGIDPPFVIVLPWINKAIDYVNASKGSQLLPPERKRVAEARKFIAEELRRRKSVGNCVLLLLNESLKTSYGWYLDNDSAAKIITALGNTSFAKGCVGLDVFTKEDELSVRVELSQKEFETLVGCRYSLLDVSSQLSRYCAMHRQLVEMPQWFLATKALPALLDKYVIHDELDPAGPGAPLRVEEWFVGPA